MKDKPPNFADDSHGESQIALLENYFRSDHLVGLGNEGASDLSTRNGACLPDDTRSRKIVNTIHAVKELIASNHKVYCKRGKYHRYSTETKEEIARYAVENGTLAAKKLYREKLGIPISESTVRNFVKHHAYFSPDVKTEVGRCAYEFGLDQAIEYFSKKLGYPLTRALAKKFRSEYLDLKSVNETVVVNVNHEPTEYPTIVGGRASCGSSNEAVTTRGIKCGERLESEESDSKSLGNCCEDESSVSQQSNERGDGENARGGVTDLNSCVAPSVRTYNYSGDLSFGDLHLGSTNFMSRLLPSPAMPSPCIPVKSTGQSFSFYVDKNSPFTLRSHPTNLISTLEHSDQSGCVGSYSLVNIEENENQLSLMREIATNGFSVVELGTVPCAGLPSGKSISRSNSGDAYSAEPVVDNPTSSLKLDAIRPSEVGVRETDRKDHKPKRKSAYSKRGNYVSYSPEQRAEIGKYAAEYGNAAAIQHFRKKFGHDIPESTVRGLKERFMSEKLSGDKVSFLGLGPRGRPMRLGKYDKVVQECVRELVDSGEKVNCFVAIATAREVICQHEPSLLDESGGPIKLTESWAKSFLKRMKIKDLKKSADC